MSIFFACSIIAATAQEPLLKSEYSYRRYTTQDGLPNMMFHCIHQDAKGFIWIGTGKGFSRFDGLVFTNFYSDMINNMNYIRNSSNGGVRIYSSDHVYTVDSRDSVIKKRIAPDSLYIPKWISRDLPPDYFIYSNNKDTHKYLMRDEGNCIREILRLPALDSIPAVGDYPFLDLQTERVYIPGKEARIYDLRFHSMRILKGINASNFVRHSRLGVLAQTADGLYSVGGDVHKIANVKLRNSLQNQVIEMQDGSLLVKDDETIYKIQEGKAEKLLSRQANLFMNTLCDKEGNLWLLSYDGIYNYFHFDFKNYSVENDAITSIVQDNENNYWAGTLYAQMFKFSDNNTSKLVYPEKKLGSFFPGALSFNGILYFLHTSDGIVMRKDKNKFSHTNLPQGNYKKIVPLENGHIVALHPSRGLYEFDKEGNTVAHLDMEKDILQSYIADVAVNKSGELIVAGEEGLSIIGKDSSDLWKPALIRDSYEDGMTMTVCIDREDNIWSSCNNSLQLLLKDTIITVHQFNKDIIQCIQVVNDQYLLIATLQKIYLFDSKIYLESKKIQYSFYDHRNGMIGIEPEVHGLYLDKKGIMWLITSNYLVSFKPEELTRKKMPPMLHILNFQISTDNVSWKYEAKTANLNLDYHYNNIRISFIGINFSATENVRYHYRLLGFQNQWSEPTKQREVTFNNLPPGDYTFEIYADSGTEESKSEIQSITFSIQPAFWQTTWFLILAIIILSSLSFLSSLIILQRKNRNLMEKLRAEKELNELRISSIRLKAIPHFNANVLAAIEYYIANRTKEEAMRILSIYSDFMLKTLSEVDKAARPLSEELAYVKMYLDLEKIRFLDKFDFRINVEEGVDKNVQLPNMILHTYCENAVKHGLMPLKSGGLLTIHVLQREQAVCVHVEDNGVGRASAAQNPHLHSTKQGLSILNRQIEIYNRFNRQKIRQQIEDLLSAGKPSGTRFIIEVPLNFTYIT
ncbi:hypothetical protein FACS1894182_12550 [Bacteroidia bacterium]|nr:hypothetical protein FACS1894182_12550 [Bacteroidia bacterium]